MPHPLREKAGSRMVYSIPLAIFIDDVSGNKSKQWNKHFSCYMSNGALPRTKLENEFHVRFVATSPFTSPLEIMQGVRSSIEEAFSEPVVAWDCELKEEVLLRPYSLLFAGDNPMQAELCSCAGLNTNFFCRTCKAGGTREWKQSNEGFSDILKPNVATTLTEAVRLSGVKDSLAQPIIDLLVKMGQDLRKANLEGSSYSPDEFITCYDFSVGTNHTIEGIDMHKDTPTEILHTILLGVVKYYWGQTVWLLEKGKDFALFQTRLNSILSDGLNIPKIQADYMCQYKGGLIGKHFKTLSQIMAFTIEGLVPSDVLEAWLILGRLTVLLWHTEIDDVMSYTAELDVCINDFINITCKCSPSILISKPKFHFLLHLPFFIRRFGPAVLFSTERYEAYNAVFRACSIYSNRLTPSRDIAWSFAGIDRVKHIVTGGWWKDSRTRKWTCANPRVMRHILEHPEMAAMVGLPTKVIQEPGELDNFLGGLLYLTAC
ncbi:hypothetical protein B0H10DRAFT_1815561 [Mycena sp. CBHHK59/15]|nr:hypothetical protein B0H10DRAFT_1815561 [Mycena sp. CBHHK59/15]